MEKQTVARPYAKAVFACAKGHDAFDHWSKALQVLSVIVSDAKVSAYLEQPLHQEQTQVAALTEIAGDMLDEQNSNFLRLLAHYGKLALLPEIAALFEHYRAEHDNLVFVNVRSAVALDATQEKNLAASLSKRIGKAVDLHVQIDEELIGGVIIQADDLVIDGSVKGKLSRLQHELEG